MKRMLAAAACMAGLSLAAALAGCSSQPSADEVRASIDAGTLTVQDAIERGWVDQAWVDENYPSVPAGTKERQVPPFNTALVDGAPISQDAIAGKQLIVLIDAAQPGFGEEIGILAEAQERLEPKGVSIMGFLVNYDGKAEGSDLPETSFPLAVCNDETGDALGANEMFSEPGPDPETTIRAAAAFAEDGSLYSAWLVNPTEDDLVDLGLSSLGDGEGGQAGRQAGPASDGGATPSGESTGGDAAEAVL